MGRENETGGNGPETVLSAADMKKLLRLLSEIAYGSITLVIQNGKVVQVEKNEKIRLK